MTPARFRRKPRTVEAVLYDGTDESIEMIRKWTKPRTGAFRIRDELCVISRDQHIDLRVGDWLARDEDGRLLVIDDDDLAENYEREGDVDEQADTLG